METLRGKPYTARPIDPRDFERRLPKALAPLILLVLSLGCWAMIWLFAISPLVAAVTR